MGGKSGTLKLKSPLNKSHSIFVPKKFDALTTKRQNLLSSETFPEENNFYKTQSALDVYQKFNFKHAFVQSGCGIVFTGNCF